MNKDRRKAINAVYQTLTAYETAFKALPDLEEIKSHLEALRDEEQDYLDSMPESLQDSERGQAAHSAISAMENAINSLEEITDIDFHSSLENALEELNNAENV